jgi:hypothetical protein
VETVPPVDVDVDGNVIYCVNFPLRNVNSGDVADVEEEEDDDDVLVVTITWTIPHS